MNRLILTIFMLFPLSLPAQVVVKGVVTEQNSGNKPIAGVQLLALGANPEVSDHDGRFSLTFQDKTAGERIRLTSVTKSGYELVNREEAETWVIPSEPDKIMKIVLCPAGQLAANRLKYYRISFEALTKGYRDKVGELEKQRDKAGIDARRYAEQLQLLEDQYRNQQKELEQLADRFARENFDDCSEVHKQAFWAFQTGNIEEAIRILETTDSEKEILLAEHQKEKGKILEKEGQSMQQEADSILNLMRQLKLTGKVYELNLLYQSSDRVFDSLLSASKDTSFTNRNDYKSAVVGIYTDWAQVQVLKKDYQKAETVIRKGLSFDQDKLPLNLLLTGVLVLQKKQKEAKDQFLQIKKKLTDQEDLQKRISDQLSWFEQAGAGQADLKMIKKLMNAN